MNAKAVRVFNHYFLDQAVSPNSVVSAPLPMTGNTIRMVLNVYSIAGTSLPQPSVTIQLEGSVLGEVWEDITPTSGTTNTGTIGGVRALYSGVTDAMLRVRVTVAGDNTDTKVWFTVGMSFTSQGS